MNYVVTGAFGFIGQNLIRTLRKEVGTRIYIPKGNINKEISFSVKLPKKIHYVYHLAAETNTRDVSGFDTYINNLTGFIKILEFSLKNKSKLIYATSSAVYGVGNSSRLIPYAHSKLLTELIGTQYINKLSIVGLRFFNVYGPNEEHKKNMASMITQWARQIKRGERPVAFGKEKALRDHIYVKDLVKALICAKSVDNGIYDAGSGTVTNFNDILKFVQKSLGTKLKPIWIKNPYKGEYQMYTKADLNWGFKPDYTVEEGIKDYLSTYPNLKHD